MSDATTATLPEISVIVTNRNYRKFLPECLDSLSEQTLKFFEVIVVDDASGDDSVHYLTRRRDVDCLITFKDNRGTSEASNAGIRAARGKYCVLVNADDTVRSDFLFKTYSALRAAQQANPKVAFAYTDFWHKGIGHDGKVIDNGVEFPDYSFENLKKFNFILASALFDRAVFDKVGGFQIDYGLEDYDLWLRMGLAGYSGVHVPGYLYQYRAHSSNRSLTIDAGSVSDKIRARLNIGEASQPTLTPKYALCYTTRRIWMAKKVCELWMNAAVNPGRVNIYLTYDDGDVVLPYMDELSSIPRLKLIRQDSAPFNAVHGWNVAAENSKDEEVIIAISDDFVPPKDWDATLLGIDLADSDGQSRLWPYDDIVVSVNDGNNSSVDKPITLPIITRKRYNRFGYIYHPTYESLFCDRELTDVAKAEGKILEAKHILFDHCHPSCFKRESDIVDLTHASTERWDSGQKNYDRRKALGFPIRERRVDADTALWCFDDTLDTWKAYVAGVRPAVYAISYELSTWLKSFVALNRPKSILELGANFSAFIFAQYAKEAGSPVSLDVQDVDLPTFKATQEFIQSRVGVGYSASLIRPEYIREGSFVPSGNTPKYDLVFVDIGDANDRLRLDVIKQLLTDNHLTDNAVVILDDGHFLGVQNVNDYLVSIGWKSIAPKLTFDRYDRFSFVLHKPSTTIQWP